MLLKSERMVSVYCAEIFSLDLQMIAFREKVVKCCHLVDILTPV